ncbi:hypothetical protein Hanom_Chr07g00655631 [Helianthus anomalus]
MEMARRMGGVIGISSDSEGEAWFPLRVRNWSELDLFRVTTQRVKGWSVWSLSFGLGMVQQT